jgi:hypothetical protein
MKGLGSFAFGLSAINSSTFRRARCGTLPLLDCRFALPTRLVAAKKPFLQPLYVFGQLALQITLPRVVANAPLTRDVSADERVKDLQTA